MSEAKQEPWKPPVSWSNVKQVSPHHGLVSLAAQKQALQAKLRCVASGERRKPPPAKEVVPKPPPRKSPAWAPSSVNDPANNNANNSDDEGLAECHDVVLKI